MGMVIMYGTAANRLQQVNQAGIRERQSKHELVAQGIRTQSDADRAGALVRFKNQISDSLTIIASQFFNVLHDAAPGTMRNMQHFRHGQRAQQLYITLHTGGFQWICLNETLHISMIIRMQLIQYPHRAIHQRLFIGREADSAFMIRIQIGRQYVEPTGFQGALAQVIFFAIAAAKFFRVKITDLVQAGAADIHAETNTGRRGNARQLRAPEYRVDGVHVKIERLWIFLKEIREAADRRIIRKWRNGGDIRTCVRFIDETHQPIMRHHHIAVEQDDILRGKMRKTTIDGAHKSQIAQVLQHVKASWPDRRQLFKHSLHASIRTAIIDRQQFRFLECQHTRHGSFNAAACHLDAPINGQNDRDAMRRYDWLRYHHSIIGLDGASSGRRRFIDSHFARVLRFLRTQQAAHRHHRRTEVTTYDAAYPAVWLGDMPGPRRNNI
ncbi:hypothetical protein D3C81_415430 [compost metagenome]